MGNEEIKKIIALFDKGRELYKNRQFEEALKYFAAVRKINKEDGPAGYYIKRCQDYIQAPPPADWDGVYVRTTK